MKHPLSAMRVFIGLELHKTDDIISEQYWLDGTTVDYNKWDFMKPDKERVRTNECVIMIPERRGVWSDWSCANSCCAKHAVYSAICEIDHDNTMI
ncbi:unnamed protein product [Wuchereria bancrofti]|nr:unnamed protein product [Wuchereria bancrofti]